MEFEQMARDILSKERGFVIDDFTAQDRMYRRELDLILQGMGAATAFVLSKIPSSVDCEKEASSWSSLHPRRWAQDFYEGCHFVRSHLFSALKRAGSEIE